MWQVWHMWQVWQVWHIRQERRTMTEEQLKTIYQLYTDLWKMFRQYYTARTDKEWEKLAERAAEIVEQYGEDVRPLVLDTLELIERSSKNEL